MRYCLVLLSLLFSAYSYSAITEIQPLSFGNFAAPSNAVVSTLTIGYMGGHPSVTNRIYVLSPPQPGQFQLTDYPPWTPLMINISNFQLVLGASPSFLIEDFTTNSIITDGSGQALLRVGATLKTTGTGGTYGDGGYTGNMNITISW